MDSVREILASMGSIGLENMQAYALMNRVDTKYIFGAELLPDVLRSVADEYRALHVEGSPLSPYETLYFDTPDHTHYLQHHNGRLNRYKYRMRRYVASDLCFLEVKARSNKGRTDKQRVVLDSIEQTLSESSKEYLRTVTGTEPDLLPQLWCEFSRITLVAPRQRERVTLDVGLAFRHNGDRHEVPGLVIAEVKQARADRGSPLRRELKLRGVREMRVSKYCLGCAFLKPHLKHNRFKPRLSAVHKIASRTTTHDGNL